MGFKPAEYYEFIGKGMTAEEMQKAVEAKRAKDKPPLKPLSYRWVISEFRKDKRVGVIKPVLRSNYARALFKIGAGW
jgi:hypothetical protein